MFLVALIVCFTIPLQGYVLYKNKIFNPVPLVWILVFATVFAIKQLDLLVGQSFFLISVSIILWFKVVVCKKHLLQKQLNFIQWCLFNYAWIGMNPTPFLSFPAKPFKDWYLYVLNGVSRIVIGYGIILFARFYVLKQLTPNTMWVAYFFYLFGIAFILYFGILTISAGALRLLGVPVTKIFKSPGKSKTFQEFWGKRWNLAFIELCSIAVFRPLVRRVGAIWATAAVFAFSAILHELSNTVSVNAGYGKPSLFYGIQCFMVLIVEKKWNIYFTKPFIPFVWIVSVIVGTIFLAFPFAFCQKVVLPLIDILTLGY